MTPKTRLATALIVLTPTLARAGGESEEAPDPFPTLGAELALRSAAPAPIQRGNNPRPLGEVWAVTYDNSLFGFHDRNITNGWSVGWLSDDVDNYDNTAKSKRFRNWLADLGWVGDNDVTDRVSFTLGQEMFTPRNFTDSIPDPDRDPYAGLLYFDAMIHTRHLRERHTWAFRLGLVGPWSGAEAAQDGFQDLLGGDRAEAWDTQLPDELVVNVNYEYRYRAKEGQWGDLDYDLEPILGWSAGTYSIYANAGAELRLGKRMSTPYGVTNYRTGARTHGIDAPSGKQGFAAHGFLTAQGWGVLKYLPLGGSTFKNSADVDIENFAHSWAGGLAVTGKNVVFRWTLGWVSGKYDNQRAGERKYGMISASWSR